MAAHRAALSSFLLFSIFLSFTEARDHLVGGKPNAWNILSSESESLNRWAESSRFHVGDSLVWNYDPKKDSVLQVTKKDYESCNTANPIAVYKDENTKVTFDKSGPFYFISGAEEHCEKGQKLVTVVMAPRSRLVGVSPAPSPTEFEGPAVAPSSGDPRLRVSLVVTAVGSLVVLVLL